MTISSSTLMAFAAVCCLSTSGLFAQTDYTTKTLRFSDITNDNVNQTVTETTTNEKEVEFGDFDNDGDMDVVMAVGQSDFGQRRNKLYRNDAGVLNEVSGSPVISGFSATDTSRSAYFRDYDGDGWLDIVIINDSNSGAGSNGAPGKTKLYRNVGGTSFVNESQRLDNLTGAACNGCSADFDNNGLPDVMMANYPNTTQDSLALNGFGGLADGQFDNVTVTHMPDEGGGGSDIPNGYAVHAETADMNGDGLLDLLVTNRTNEPAYIHYNNNNGAGSGDGDFRYAGTGARSTIPDAVGGVSENAMFPADFNNDGMMDIYFANYGGGLSDAILINTGVDNFNRATFAAPVMMPSSVNGETYKVDCTDLDEDGKVDLVVMAVNRNPIIFRNTSENGEITFVDWTPDSVDKSQHRGWHANAANVIGPDRADILIGATNDDYLFENNLAVLSEFDDLTAGILPDFHNDDSIAVRGYAVGGETVTLIGIVGASDIPAGSDVSVLLRSSADFDLTVKSGSTVIASSTRTGQDADEAVEFNVPSGGSLSFEVTNQGGGDLLGDVNGDGGVNLLDVGFFVALLSEGGFDARADMNCDQSVNLLDVGLFVDAISNGGAGTICEPFVIEFLSK